MDRNSRATSISMPENQRAPALANRLETVAVQDGKPRREQGGMLPVRARRVDWRPGHRAWAKREDTMQSGDPQRQSIAAKLLGLSPERIAEVEDFIDFLRARETDRQRTRAGTRLAEAAFRAVWDNADDTDYDRL